MLLTLEKCLREALSAHVRSRYGVRAEPVIELPRQPAHGDLATPVCFVLARHLRRAPRLIAAEIAAELPPVEGIRSVEAAGAGYLNVRFDRAAYLLAVLTGAERVRAGRRGKVIVEHTNINPNKAAHIGHLRNAVLGDTLVRMLRLLGRSVEVQNYIDNTGVQVADVVAGFHLLRGLGPEEVGSLAADPEVRFDYLCWDLYAEISRRFAAEDPEALAWRARTLQALESGAGELAELGAVVADSIVRCHLRTMRRIGVAYDVLPRESEILKFRFWSSAFELLKAGGILRRVEEGRNAGCWVMPRELFGAPSDSDEAAREAGEESKFDANKVIVRSNGTVTYVGKDIAYQMWKFGLLEGRDFQYRPLSGAGGGGAWMSCPSGGSEEAPRFGRGDTVYNVIDVRQAYLQDVVRISLEALGFERQARRSVHFAYEMVALSPLCCAELGIELTAAERAKPYVEVSGRKGLGVKADDLIDRLIETALDEVRSRHAELGASECRAIAEKIAIGALRFFMLRFTRNTVIAFDFREALAFEGETGPYVQYAAVRALNILRKHAARRGGKDDGPPSAPALARQLQDERLWQLVRAMSLSRWAVARAAEAGEPAQVARSAFQAAQAFNNFYHQTHILNEQDPERQAVLLSIVRLALDELTRLMGVMGVPVPERM